MRKAVIFVLISALVSLSGCASLYATFRNANPSKEEPLGGSWAYVGAKTDGLLLVGSIICAGGGDPACSGGTGWLWLASPLFLVDLPLSAVADTLLLPYTLHKQNKDEHRGEKPSVAPASLGEPRS